MLISTWSSRVAARASVSAASRIERWDERSATIDIGARHAAWALRQLARDALPIRLTPAEQHQAGAERRQAVDRGASDAPRGARDHADAAGHVGERAPAGMLPPELAAKKASVASSTRSSSGVAPPPRVRCAEGVAGALHRDEALLAGARGRASRSPSSSAHGLVRRCRAR